MQKRKLGNSGLEVSALGFGCMGLNFLDGKGLGTTKLHRLEENIDSRNIVLTADELAKIDTTVNGITIVGDRYPEVLEKQIDK